jgi:hypothetical protein
VAGDSLEDRPPGKVMFDGRGILSVFLDDATGKRTRLDANKDLWPLVMFLDCRLIRRYTPAAS